LSTFVSDHDFVKSPAGGGVADFRGCGARFSAKSAQKYANPEHAAQTRCQSAAHRRVMAKIISIQFRRSRLPRRLPSHGWWLESPPVRPCVIAFPKRNAPKPKRKVHHLTLVTSGK
jgi:hypothetical protein